MSAVLHDVVILGAARTPIGKFQGGLSSIPAPQLGALAIRAALERAGIGADLVDEAIMGNVVSAGLGQAPARQAALAGGLPESASATTVNKVCAASLEAINMGARSILMDDARVVVAGGMENMSRGPHMLQGARAGIRLGNAELVDATVHDGLWCAFEDQHMGSAAEAIAEKHGITRGDQDALAMGSHRKALAALEAGRFDAEIVAVEVEGRKGTARVERDESPRADTSLEALAALRPVFVPTGCVTAGNAPGLTDGAAAVVLASEEVARAEGLQPLARLVGYATVGVEPRWLFEAPVAAIRKLLDRTGTQLSDWDLLEVNEAFAAQVLANGRALDWDWDRVNVNGGAIALGHPLGATGARLVVTLLHALRQRGKSRGLAALCHGGGGAVALGLELV
jgi:acetyl-CoA C-acetyltransferase